MNVGMIEKVANAVLYEGYLLYPYRESSVKNRQRFNFGVLYPEGWGIGYDTNAMQTECLIAGRADTVLDVKVRFLVWDEQAHERDVSVPGLRLPDLAAHPVREEFELGELRIAAVALEGDLYRVGVYVRNTSRAHAGVDRETALTSSMISVHTIVTARGGDFISLIDPPEQFKEAAAACKNIGTWPVLAGSKGDHDAVLSSPIILYDYPEIAPESAGDLFDATEIDEILSLRIMTLTDEEKKEIRAGDDRARAILERTEQMPEEQLLKLHGVLRGLRPVSGMDWDPFADTPGRDSVRVFGVDLKKGDPVRLWPQKSADIMDRVLEGRTATIEAIEEDFEGNVQLAVVVDDDPGRDLGELRQPGHRFFFGVDEVEPVG
jgi:hypothetical protein